MDESKTRKSSGGNFPWALLVVFALAMLFGRAMVRQESGSFDLGKPLPPLQVEGWLNTDGPLTNSQFAGQVLLVDCWATWCGPCRAKMPALVDLKERYREQEVIVLGFTSESEAERSTVANYVDTVTGLDWPIAYGSKAMFQAMNVSKMPTLLVFNRQGKLVWRGHSLAQAEEALVKSLAAQG